MLELNMEFRKGILFVRLKGMLNKQTVNIFNKEILEMIRLSGLKYLLYNFEELNGIDVLGIKVLVKSLNLINSNNGQMIICKDFGVVHNALINSELFNHINHLNNELKVFELLKV